MKLYFTKRGYIKLRDEIEAVEKQLKDTQGQTAEVAELGGDQWHDNAGYDQLVIDIRGLDKRLSQMHETLSNAVVIPAAKNAENVAIGTQIRVIRDNQETILSILGYGESDPQLGVLAYNTPLAKLLMGKKKGEKIKGNIGDKPTEIEILEISVIEGV